MFRAVAQVFAPHPQTAGSLAQIRTGHLSMMAGVAGTFRVTCLASIIWHDLAKVSQRQSSVSEEFGGMLDTSAGVTRRRRGDPSRGFGMNRQKQYKKGVVLPGISLLWSVNKKPLLMPRSDGWTGQRSRLLLTTPMPRGSWILSCTSDLLSGDLHASSS